MFLVLLCRQPCSEPVGSDGKHATRTLGCMLPDCGLKDQQREYSRGMSADMLPRSILSPRWLGQVEVVSERVFPEADRWAPCVPTDSALVFGRGTSGAAGATSSGGDGVRRERETRAWAVLRPFRLRTRGGVQATPAA
jgi:hypothetical protein